MSELSKIVENVQAISANLNETRQAVSVWQSQLAQSISYILEQTEGSNQANIKDCLLALRSAIGSTTKMQEALGLAIIAANTWIEKNSESSAPPPMPNHVFSFSSTYDSEDEPTHSRRR